MFPCSIQIVASQRCFDHMIERIVQANVIESIGFGKAQHLTADAQRCGGKTQSKSQLCQRPEVAPILRGAAVEIAAMIRETLSRKQQRRLQLSQLCVMLGQRVFRMLNFKDISRRLSDTQSRAQVFADSESRP